MEKAGYREQHELLLAYFPGRAAISVSEVAGILGTRPETVYQAIRRVKDPLPSRKVLGKVLVPVTGLARWMAT